MRITVESMGKCSMREGGSTGLPALLVFADDWGRHPSSCQHLIGHLLDRYEVSWVNTIGMRRPRLDLATVSRGVEKFTSWLAPGSMSRASGTRARQHPNLRVLDPTMWPSFGSALGRRVNRELLVRQLGPVLASLPEPPVAVTTIPIVADLVGQLPVRRWVYYCVDDFAEWPGLDGPALRALEAKLVARVDALLAVSEPLREKLERIREPVHLLTHGVDLDHWRNDAPGDQRLAWIETLERPLAVFWGVIDRRMDVAFLRRLASEMDRGTILLVGPESDPDPVLASLPRVTRRPPVPYGSLPLVARAADVLIM